ncbi:trypsin-like serine peptidase [Coleofasciculus sp. H7-2]|uniref:trypsin-like serine peptidase n=1 Tax=Coleofasciculus sp. H7-2 TaxID=3351545 RepID=UPI00366BD2F4
MSITVTPWRDKLIQTRFLPIIFRGRLRLSAIPSEPGENYPVDAIADAKLVEIVNSRFDPDRASLISAVFGTPDFIPFSFLELGLRRGAAVCRLVQDFSDSTGKDLVEAIFELEKQLENQSKDKIFLRPELEEIFSMSEKGQDFAENFFQGVDEARPSNALKDTERFRKLLPIPVATGFLVGSSYLMTNNHVLPSKEVCDECIAEFGYDQDVLGRKISPIQYKLDSEGFFETNEELDYTLVKLQDRPQDIKLSNLGKAGYYFGWITLDEKSINIAPPIDDKKVAELQAKGFQLKIPQGQSMEGEPVNIIQHPKGKRKQVILSSNRVTNIYEKFIQYQADADFSSSGSPVFNQQWELVALHHAAVAKTKDDSTLEIEVEQGIRTCEIVKDLKKKKKTIK